MPMTRPIESTAPTGGMLMAFELGQRSWKLGFTSTLRRWASAATSPNPTVGGGTGRRTRPHATPCYRNRRRIRGIARPAPAAPARRALERPFAHLYETGGMRRVHLRGHTNIRKRLLIHAGGFNLGLLMRRLIGVGTPRGLQGRRVAAVAALMVLIAPSGSP